jgi:CubicO group peptidase (beta-lactamase class C family)
MKQLILFIMILLNVSVVNAQSNTKHINAIDTYVAQVKKQYAIDGIALAIIKDGEIIHENYYGTASIEHSVPVSQETLFPIFSTTKVFSVIATHQLIEQKKLSLDNSLSDFLIDLPASWKKIQIKHLLTHSSGLPDIVTYENSTEAVAKEKVYADAIKFSAGNQFDYNQTNFWLLNRIFKKVAGKNLSTYIIESQFPANTRKAIFEGRSLKVVPNLTYGYVHSAETDEVLKRNWNFPDYMYGASALNLTLNSFITWNKNLDDGLYISETTKKKMLVPFKYTQQRDFYYGLDLIKANGESSYGFSGGVATAFRKFPRNNLTVILLSNGMFIPTENHGGINEVVNNIHQLTEKTITAPISSK